MRPEVVGTGKRHEPFRLLVQSKPNCQPRKECWFIKVRARSRAFCACSLNIDLPLSLLVHSDTQSYARLSRLAGWQGSGRLRRLQRPAGYVKIFRAFNLPFLESRPMADQHASLTLARLQSAVES